MKKIIILLCLFASNAGAMDKDIDKSDIAPDITYEEMQALFAKNERWQQLNTRIEYSRNAGEGPKARLALLQEKKRIEENIKRTLRGEIKPPILPPAEHKCSEEQQRQKEEKRRQKNAKHRERYATDPEYADKIRAKDREKHRILYADPAYAEKRRESRHTRYATDPAYAEKQRGYINKWYKKTQQLKAKSSGEPEPEPEREREYERASSSDFDDSSTASH